MPQKIRLTISRWVLKLVFLLVSEKSSRHLVKQSIWHPKIFILGTKHPKSFGCSISCMNCWWWHPTHILDGSCMHETALCDYQLVAVASAMISAHTLDRESWLIELTPIFCFFWWFQVLSTSHYIALHLLCYDRSCCRRLACGLLAGF